MCGALVFAGFIYDTGNTFNENTNSAQDVYFFQPDDNATRRPGVPVMDTDRFYHVGIRLTSKQTKTNQQTRIKKSTAAKLYQLVDGVAVDHRVEQFPCPFGNP